MQKSTTESTARHEGLNGKTPFSGTQDAPQYRPPTTSDILSNLSQQREQFTVTPNIVAELSSIALRKPGRLEWFRTHPDDNMHGCFRMHEADGQLYYLIPDLRVRYRAALRLKRLVFCVNSDGEAFLWPITLPDDGGELDDFARRHDAATRTAKHRWVCYRWDPKLKKHQELTSDHMTQDPVWPALDLDQILALAFKDCVISDADHPALRKIDGRLGPQDGRVS